MAEQYFYSNQWHMDDDGMMRQTLDDIQDGSVRLFTEAARANNQKLQDGNDGSAVV